MNKSLTFLLVLSTLTLLLVTLSTLKIASRPFKKIKDTPYRESSAYAWWLSGTVAMLIASFLPATNVMFEVVDLLYGTAQITTSPTGIGKVFTPALTTFAILIVIAVAWFWLWQLLGAYLIKSFHSQVQPVMEMELGNHTYFLARAIISFMGMIVLLPFYMYLLRYFLPSITVPFYR
jgi:hypothetical protein